MKSPLVQLVVLLIIVMLSLVPASARDDAASSEPVLHLLGTGSRYAQEQDPLIPDAALRLVSAELAARHGVYARFWPADQQKGLGRTDYPRLQIKRRGWAEMDYLRLERKGNVFTSSVSQDGETWFVLNRREIELPPRTYIGVYSGSLSKTSDCRAVFRDLRTEGVVQEDWKVRTIGAVSEPGTLTREGGAYVLESNEMARDRRGGQPGDFYSTQCEGDFTLHVKIDDFSGDVPYYKVGLLCQGSLEPATPHAATLRQKGMNSSQVRVPGSTRDGTIWDPTLIDMGIILHLGPKNKRDLGTMVISSAYWPQMIESIERVAAKVRAVLREELHQELPPAATPATLTQQQLDRLADARQLARQVKLGSVLQAAQQVEHILGQVPASPEAHYTAAFCGVVPACQELYGSFHQRGRYLAGPMAHYLLASKLALPDGLEARLTEAWLMAICGYPTEALSVLDSLSESDRNVPEARALRMLVTGDYRAFTEKSILQGTTLEQIFWVKAVQNAGRDGLMSAACARLAAERHVPGLLPLAWADGVGPARRYSRMALRMACARDLSDLLGSNRLPADSRREVARELGRLLNAPTASSLQRTADGLAWSVYDSQNELPLADLLAAMMKLYAIAEDVPGTPVTPSEDGFAWRCVPVHDAAKVQRGLLMQTLVFRFWSLSVPLGAPQAAEEVALSAAEGLQSVQGAPAYFRLLAALAKESKPQIRSRMTEAMRHNLARIPMQVGQLKWWGYDIWYADARQEVKWHAGRGYWDWWNLGRTGRRINQWMGQNFANRMLQVSDGDVGAWRIMYAYEKNPLYLEKIAGRGSYDLGSLSFVASEMSKAGNRKQAVELLRRCIAQVPDDIDRYRQLAGTYRAMRRKGKVMEVAREGIAKCPPSVTRSNLMADLAILLLERGKAQEGMQWAREAAGSYSSSGLRSLALALIANGRDDPARQVLRARAERYVSGVALYLQFLLQDGVDGQAFWQKVDTLYQEHAGLEHRVTEELRTALVRMGRADLLDGRYEEITGGRSETQRARDSLAAKWFSRDFDAVALNARQLQDAEEELTPVELMRLHVALRMEGKTDQAREVGRKLRDEVDDDDVGFYARVIAAGETASDALSARLGHREYAKLLWLRGVEHELAGRQDLALAEYQEAANLRSDHLGWFTPRLWSWQMGDTTRGIEPREGD